MKIGNESIASRSNSGIRERLCFTYDTFFKRVASSFAVVGRRQEVFEFVVESCYYLNKILFQLVVSYLFDIGAFVLRSGGFGLCDIRSKVDDICPDFESLGIFLQNV